MPAWSWYIIWAVSILGSGALMVAAMIMTIRRLLRLFEAFAALLNLGSILGNPVEAPPEQPREPAVLLQRADALEAWRQLAAERLQRRGDRRQARLARAKRLIATGVAVPERFRG